MRLLRFQVQGFKNFREPVVIEGLGAINVIHGENNVGKSNLLQAIDLFFQVLGGTDPERVLPNLHQSPDRWNNGPELEDWFAELGYPPSEIFNLESPRHIKMLGQLSVDAEYLAALALPIRSLNHAVGLQVALDIARDPRLRYQFPSIQLIDQDLHSRHSGRRSVGLQVLVQLLKAQEPHFASRYMLVGTDRRISIDRHPRASGSMPPAEERSGSIVPQPLLLALYDAKGSLEPRRYRRWELFVEVMKEFEDILGKGQLVATFDRRTGEANLALQTASARIPIGVQGSGVQQLVALLARLLMSDATIIAIEEPELSLRFDLQRRVRDVLAKITASPAGPSQIFLTSHSPAFESGEHFYAMRATERGPVLEQRKVEEAPLFTTHTLAELPQGRTAPLSYVSSDGLVQLPASIRQTLGLDHGGGVVILKRDEAPYVELLTNEQFLDLLSGTDGTEPGHDQG